MKGNKKLLIFSILCIVAGLVLAVFSGVRDGGYLKQLLGDAGNARLQEKKTVDVTEDFHSLTVTESSADVQLLPSEDGGCRVVYGEDEYSRCRVSVENGVLTVARETKDHARSGLVVFEETLPVCIYLPVDSYQALSVTASSGDFRSSGGYSWETAAIETHSGDIRLEELSAEILTAKSGSGDVKLRGCSVGSLQLESSSGGLTADTLSCSGDGQLRSGSGDIELEESSFRSLVISATSGKVKLVQTVCSGSLKAETASGDIRLRKASAASFDFRSTSGDVTGSVIGSVDFITETASGSVRTRGSVRGGAECRVRTGSGDVDLEVDR